MNRYKISFAGAGRVGGAICRELFNAGYQIDNIVTQTEKSGRLLADSCNAKWSKELFFNSSTEIIIVAVPDKKLEIVLKDLQCSNDTLVVHTAGSFGIDVFPEKLKRRGVFYPLQTFSNNRRLSFKNLPFLIESSDIESGEIMRNIAISIGGVVYISDTVHRRMLHVAAVFACNFINHMLTGGKEIAGRAGYSFDILMPLINETISKGLTMGPENSQTGPAFRNDLNTIEKHLELLSFSPDLKKIYKEITESIIQYYKPSNSG